MPLDGIVLPKTETPEAVCADDARLAAHGAPPTLRLWAMIETPRVWRARTRSPPRRRGPSG